MSKYFSKFPKLYRDSRLVTDILTRTTVISDILNDAKVYYDYDLRDGDTPEIVAAKYYKDPEMHWVIMLVNNIVDNKFDLPLNRYDFDKYIENKYSSLGGIDYARATLNTNPIGYRGVIETTDLITGIVTVEKFFIDEQSFLSNNDSPELDFFHEVVETETVRINQYTETVSIYDYELEKNEEKRKIKLLDSTYLKNFVSQFESLVAVSYG